MPNGGCRLLALVGEVWVILEGAGGYDDVDAAAFFYTGESHRGPRPLD